MLRAGTLNAGMLTFLSWDIDGWSWTDSTENTR